MTIRIGYGRWMAGASMLVVAGATVPLALREARLTRQEATAMTWPVRSGSLPSWCDAGASGPRTSLACARIAIRAGDAAPPRLADLFIRLATTARAGWPAPLVERAFLLDATGASRAAGTRALAASYRAAPYLRSAAVWRVGYAARLWPVLPRETRAAAVEEASWYGGIDRASAAAMAGRVVGTPIEVALLLRDADAQAD